MLQIYTTKLLYKTIGKIAEANLPHQAYLEFVRLWDQFVLQNRPSDEAQPGRHASTAGVQMNPMFAGHEVEPERSLSRSALAAPHLSQAETKTLSEKLSDFCVGARDVMMAIGVDWVVLARIFRAVLIIGYIFESFENLTDDDNTMRPVFYSLFSLSVADMIASAVLNVWQHIEGSGIEDTSTRDFYQVSLESLETSVSVIRMIGFIREVRGVEETDTSEIATAVIGFSVASLGLLSDIKGQLLSSPYSHSHRLKFSVASSDPRDDEVPLLERSWNATLRVGHIFTNATVLQYSLMDVLLIQPFVIPWLEIETNDALVAAPFAVAYTLSSILTVNYFNDWLVKSDAFLQALTIGSLSFIGAFLFAIDPQIWFDYEMTSDYILNNPSRFWLTAMLPAILLTFTAVCKTLQDHQRNIEAKKCAESGIDWVKATIRAKEDMRLTSTDKKPPVSGLVESLTGRRQPLLQAKVSLAGSLNSNFTYHAALSTST